MSDRSEFWHQVKQEIIESGKGWGNDLKLVFGGLFILWLIVVLVTLFITTATA